MPISYKIGKKEIKSWIESVITGPEFVILDLGCGKGTYGELIESPCVKIGVDAVDYSKAGNWKCKYTQSIIADIRNTTSYLHTVQGKESLCILGDVLEHLTVSDAQKLISRLKEVVSYILVAVPYLYPQSSKNTYEVHRQDDLTHDLFMTRYPGFYLQHQVSRKQSPIYGYYTWSKMGNSV